LRANSLWPDGGHRRYVTFSAVLSEQSPLNSLPDNLPRKQVLFYDALAQSFEVIERTYRGLQGVLAEHALSGENLSGPARRRTTVDALIAAWGMVDALHRVGRLLGHTPGLKHGPAITSVVKTIAPVEALRHEMQHLDEHIDMIAETAMPVWGCLSWVTVIDQTKVASSLLMPGHIAEGEFRVINPVGKRVEAPVDLVTLSAAGEHVDLSQQYRAINVFAERFERGAAAAWAQWNDSPVGEVVRVNVPL
jgi:hypothetical protein